MEKALAILDLSEKKFHESTTPERRHPVPAIRAPLKLGARIINWLFRKENGAHFDSSLSWLVHFGKVPVVTQTR